MLLKCKHKNGSKSNKQTKAFSFNDLVNIANKFVLVLVKTKKIRREKKSIERKLFR